MLFSPLSMRNVTLANRIVVPPMGLCAACEGVPIADHIRHYSAVATSGAALVVIASVAVTQQGKSTPESLGLWNDTQEAGFRELINAIKSTPNSAKIGLQLAHAGRKAEARWINTLETPLDLSERWENCGSSVLPFGPNWSIPSSLTVKKWK